MKIEIIETGSRAEAIEQSKQFRHREDVLSIEFLKSGKVLRVTTMGDAPETEPDEDPDPPSDNSGATVDASSPAPPRVEVPASQDPAASGVQVAESPEAGTGEAVNPETQEVVAAPGEPLPEIQYGQGHKESVAGEPVEPPEDNQA